MSKSRTPRLEILNLRPHHGMCLAFFVGKGYSDEFTRNMGRIKRLLEEGAIIRLTVDADVICEKCPNLIKSEDHIPVFRCRSADKVAGYDYAVLETLKLPEDISMSYGEFSDAVRSRIIDTGICRTICGDCQWAVLCHCNTHGLE